MGSNEKKKTRTVMFDDEDTFGVIEAMLFASKREKEGEK